MTQILCQKVHFNFNVTRRGKASLRSVKKLVYDEHLRANHYKKYRKRNLEIN